jgi:hypothetical protein
MDRIKQLLINAGNEAIPPEVLLRAFNDLFARQCLNSAGAAVSSAAAVTWKTSNTIFAMVNGVLQTKTTANFPALTGYNLTSAQVGLIVGTVDGSGNLGAVYATPAATLGQLVMPVVPFNQAAVAVVVLNTAATFTGGTTAMDTSGISYINIVGPFSPTSAF